MKLTVILYSMLVLAGLWLLALPTNYMVMSNTTIPTLKPTLENTIQFKEVLHIANTNETKFDLVRWSPVSNLISVSDFDTVGIRLIDAYTGEVKEILLPNNDVTTESYRANVVAMEWSPNGKFLAVAYEYDWLYVWRIGTNQEAIKFYDEGTSPSISWHPNSTQLAIARIRSSSNENAKLVSVYDISSGERRDIFPTEYVKDISTIAWSLTDTWVATSSPSGEITLWDAHTYRPTDKLLELPEGLSSLDVLAWYPYKNKLSGAACNLGLGNCQLWIWDTDVDELMISSATNFGRPRALIWHPDGTVLLAVADNTQLWNIKTNHIVAQFGLIVSASWSPSGNSLVTIDEHRTMSIWKVL